MKPRNGQLIPERMRGLLTDTAMLKLVINLQDRQHIFKVQMKDPNHDAVNLLHALKELEQDEGMAKQIGEAGRSIAEDILTPDNVRRCVLNTIFSTADLLVSLIR